MGRINTRNIDRDGAESGTEMAMALWNTGVFTSCEQGQRTCEQLVKKGLLVRLGWDENYARCYGPSQSEQTQ